MIDGSELKFAYSHCPFWFAYYVEYRPEITTPLEYMQ